MQHHNLALMLIWHCLNVACTLGSSIKNSPTQAPYESWSDGLDIWYINIFCLSLVNYRSETAEKVPSDLCGLPRLKKASTSVLSDENLHCPHEKTLHASLSNLPSEDSDQTVHLSKGMFSSSYVPVCFTIKIAKWRFWSDCTLVQRYVL